MLSRSCKAVTPILLSQVPLDEQQPGELQHAPSHPNAATPQSNVRAVSGKLVIKALPPIATGKKTRREYFVFNLTLVGVGRGPKALRSTSTKT